MAMPAVEVEQRADLYFVPAYAPLFNPLLRWFFMWGGRDAGRSWAASRKIVLEAMEARIRVACIRWTREATRDSMRADVVAAIHETGNEHLWDLTKDRDITFLPTGSVIMFRGLLNQKGLRSLVDIDLAWFEEPQYLEDPDFHDCLITVLRKETVRLFFTGNAQFESDPAYRWCLEERNRPHAAWLYTTSYDNPHMTDDARREREKARKFDPDRYEHEWLGKPRRTSSELTILSTAWLEASIRLWQTQKHRVSEFAPKRDFGLDPSDGGDRSIVTAGCGPFLEHVEDVTQKRGLIGNALDKTAGLIRDFNGARLYFDDGADIGTQVTQHYLRAAPPRYEVIAVNFNSPCLGEDALYGRLRNKVKFKRRNVQMYWNLRDRARASWMLDQGEHVDLEHCLVIDPSCLNGQYGAPSERDFMDQMVQCEWREKEGGQIVVDKAPRGLDSPDVFDGVGLCKHRDIERGLRIRV